MTSPEQPASASPPPTTVLILDDSPQDREVFRRFLVSDPHHDYVVHERDAIEAALDACRELHPDCVLLDYSLADGTGFDFLEALAGLGGTRQFPVIMLTGSGDERVAARAFRAGAQDYLVKTGLVADVLQRAVAAAIYKVRTERQLEAQRIEVARLYEEAQRAHARKDAFLAALSHELRTPLMPILTAVSSLNVREASAEELEETFSMIRRNVQLEVHLIDDLLDLTRVAHGKLSLDLQPVDAHELLRYALRTCQEDITRKGLVLTQELSATEHTVRADPARLQQVFWNLLKNAVKFTPTGGSIGIRTRNPAGAGKFEVEIRDSGVGIAPEALPNVFVAFEQGGSTTTRRFGGLGLGLAISKDITDALGGTLRADSAGLGRGAAFTVSIPLASAVTGKPEASAAGRGITLSAGTMAPAAPAESAAAGPVVLLVEDHADSARLLGRSLMRHGYRVFTAGTAAEATAIFEREPVEIVVSDIGLPDRDGISLMGDLRRRRPVLGIALSGYGMQNDVERSQAAGFSEHLTKPVEWSQLNSALQRLKTALPQDSNAS